MTTTYTTFSALMKSARTVGKAKIDFGLDSEEYKQALQEHEIYLQVCKTADAMLLHENLFQIETPI